MPAARKTAQPRSRRAARDRAAAKPRATHARRATAPGTRKLGAKTGPFGIRTAPKGDRFHAPERAVRAHALEMPEATEDYPWGHRAFRIGKKVFLFTAWDDGVFSVTVKLPESQAVALMLPFAEPTGYGMGKSGWVTARFKGRDAVPVGLLCRWIEESYRAIAPKKPAARRSPTALDSSMYRR
jgi:predicted DNA-binding protein (MmcQ/YjbR family)